MRALLRALASLAAPALALSTLGCTADESTRIATRLQECGLLSEGELGPAHRSFFYAPDACYRDCIASASCEELDAALCRTSIALGRRCDERCAFHCPDGSLIGVERVCDGAEQCAGGADEEGCELFECSDGRALPDGWLCDGVPHCGDGGDERDCSAVFECVSTFGDTLRGDHLRCNGWAECGDGSDEEGCPSYECPDGTRFTHREGRGPRCDGFRDCFDGSDEEGCATLTLMCSAS